MRIRVDELKPVDVSDALRGRGRRAKSKRPARKKKATSRKKAPATRKPRAAKAKRFKPKPLSAEDIELGKRFTEVHAEMFGASEVAADIALKTTSEREAARYAQCFLATAMSMIEKAKRIATPFRLPLQLFGQTLRYPQDLDANPAADYKYSRDDVAAPDISDEKFREAVDEVIGVIPTFIGQAFWASSNMCAAQTPWFDGDDFVRQSDRGPLHDDPLNRRRRGEG